MRMAYSEQMWQDAKKKCRLNNDDIELAKRLGLNPRSLVKNIPNKSESWKAPVSVWLHEIDESAGKNPSKSKNARQRPQPFRMTAPTQNNSVSEPFLYRANSCFSLLPIPQTQGVFRLSSTEGLSLFAMTSDACRWAGARLSISSSAFSSARRALFCASSVS